MSLLGIIVKYYNNIVVARAPHIFKVLFIILQNQTLKVDVYLSCLAAVRNKIFIATFT